MAAERESMLIMKNVSKTFNPGTVNEKCALNGVNLTLGAGDFATIVGSNGAGKSTILKSIIGQLKLVKGEVWLDGSLMGAMKEKDIALRMSVMMTGRVKTERNIKKLASINF